MSTMSSTQKSDKTQPDFEAGEAMDEIIANNEKLPFFTRRRFQIITCASVLIAVVCLCVVVPAIVITNKNKNASSSSNEFQFGDIWITLGPEIFGEIGNQELGESIALSGDGSIMAVGSNFHTTNTGILNAYQFVGSQWRQLGQTIEGTDLDDNLGSSTQLSSNGQTLLIGAYGDARGPNQRPGHVRVYQYTESQDKWNAVGNEVSGQSDGDRFGVSSSMSSDGQTWIAGASNDLGPNGEVNGYASVYRLQGGNWVPRGATIYGNDGQFTGYAVAMSGDGDTVCVGDRRYVVPNVGERGRARCFSWSENDWKRKGGDIVGKNGFAHMGYSLALSNDGSTVVVGARGGGNDNQGSVGVYSYSGGEWKQKGEDMIGVAAEDQTGFKVAMNFDGNVIAWSARGHNGNGNDSGVVRVFRWINDSWVILGAELSGGSSEDRYGEAIALSRTGTVMAASSNSNNVEYVQAYVLV